MAGRKVLKGKDLYKVLFYGVIFAVVAVGVLAFWGVREIRRDAAVVAVENSARGLSGAVTVLVNAVSNSNSEIELKTLMSLKPSVLHAEFGKVFKQHSSLTAVMIADGQGLVYMLARRPDGLMETVPVRGENLSTVWTLWRADGSRLKTKPASPFERQMVDKTLSEEFKHLMPGKVNWRSSYRFHGASESWITASSLVETDNGESFMVSYVFPIDAIVNQLGGAEKGGAEKVFIFWETGKVLPIPDIDGEKVLGDRASKALPFDKVGDPVIAGAAARLAVDPDKHEAPFSYRVDGEIWWAYVLPLSVFGDTMSLGVAMPRRNIVSTLTSDTFLQVFGSILVFMAACVLFLLHKYRVRIEAMGMRKEAARNADDVLQLIAAGESGRLEFKQTLRFNLRSGKNGKEIEHANMKTVAAFMNSEGGTLLVGVADNGVVAGFDEDNFGNEDRALLHFNNLVNQHIGAEFARYVDTLAIKVQDKCVIRAFCTPAPTPAILKNGQDEEFYVRSGPASRQLSLSQFYEWLQNH
jgi:hypothetical protein